MGKAMGATYDLPFGQMTVEATKLSCDAKAAQLLYSCAAPNSANNFCCFGCNVNKETYVLPSTVFTQTKPPMMEWLEYIICVLHLRLRLMGHVFGFIKKHINAFKSKNGRDLLTDNLVRELARCHVRTCLVERGAASVEICEPTGDEVDKLCTNGFSVLAVFTGMLF